MNKNIEIHLLKRSKNVFVFGLILTCPVCGANFDFLRGFKSSVDDAPLVSNSHSDFLFDSYKKKIIKKNI